MKLRISAKPGEIAEKGDELLEELQRSLEFVAPELFERLEKAMPHKEAGLKFPALEAEQRKVDAEYKAMLQTMLDDIQKVLNPKPLKQPVRKSYVDHTEEIAQKDDVTYQAVQKELRRRGMATDADFEEGGRYYGMSSNELLDLLRE